MEKVSLKVEGMTCVNCAKAIEVSLKKLKGLQKVEVSFELGKVWIELDETLLSLEEIKKVIEDLGYRVVKGVQKRDYQREILLFSFSGSFLIMFLMIFPSPYSVFIQALLSILIQIIGGFKFYKGALAGLKSRVGNMDLLISLGTTSALLYSLLALFHLLPGKPFLETNTFLIAFVRLGKYIEEKAKNRALHLLKELFALQTSMVRIFTSQGEKEVAINEVLPGDVLVLKAGDLVPLDSEVEEGSLEVDESLVTGESVPVLKKKGDTLISGSLVVNGYAKAKVKELLEKSYISMLLSLVESAIKQKPPIQRLADYISHYFVQAILLISLGVFLFWYFKGSTLTLSFNFALAILVISCPCAFGLAVPLAISVALTRSYKRGLLIKDPAVFEIAPQIKVLILDKTGTLTKGQPEVISFSVEDEKILPLVLALAETSRHPYSKAIATFLKKKNIQPVEIKECREEPGKGIFCEDLFLGREKGFKGVVFKKGENVWAEFLIEDEIREGVKEILSFFKNRGIEPVLATGDTKERALKVANFLQIERVYAEIKPSEKLKLVEEEQRKGKGVAMVGDGINDAPALAKANLSFVLAEGIDLSKRVGNIILLSGLKGLKNFFEIADSVKKRIWQNLFWAFIYNLLGIPIAGGLLYSYGIIIKPEYAGMMMALSSISVVLNSIRK